jgi:protein SCO1/2
MTNVVKSWRDKMKSFRTIYFFVIGVIVLPVAAFGITQWYEWRIQRLPVLGPENHIVENFHFKNQMGEPLDQDHWKGKIVVANYFFTSCPSICPKMMRTLEKVQMHAGKNVLINSFTVDPERDSVGKLKTYADKHGIKPGWFLLTGDKIYLYKFARTDLMIDATDGDGGPGDFIHSSRLVLIDPLKHIRGYYDGTDEKDADRLIHDIEKLKNEYNL